ncbi:hypothetical protein V1514DRAFT_343219 [Lipomyces japonicus]|uniref:uncharacterized protein n=1 Tax=Lipomyces japonicus TaxID=56871 RepID=UPI0034CDD1D1
MAKEKKFNSAQAQHKKDKANVIKKAKAERARRLTEKLSKRNPERISKQIAKLKEIEQEGKLQGPDRKLLADLEKQLILIDKAKEKISLSGKNVDSGLNRIGIRDIESQSDRYQNKSGVFVLKGKERLSIYWDAVFNPTGLPPDGYPYKEWCADAGKGEQDEEIEYVPEWNEIDATGVPLPKGPAIRFNKPKEQARTTYEAAPVVRDLIKESQSFIPTVIQRAQQQRKRSVSPAVNEGSRKLRHVEIEIEEDEEGDDEY